MVEELSALPQPIQSPILIDEIQKLPRLLDEVHNAIESRGWTFLLTGSSARKLRREEANLLGGRARVLHLHPLVSAEVPDFNLERALSFGMLPSIYLSDEPYEDLRDYCGQYLQEEIAAEAAVRRIESFSRFLRAAALMSGEIINFEALSRESGILARTLREYFFILDDTLIGKLIPPYRERPTRKAMASAKFYLFDIGVAHALAQRRHIEPRTPVYGKAFEHWVYMEIAAWLSYTRDERELTYWRSASGHEVDFLIGKDVAVEIKASERVVDHQIKGLLLIGDELRPKHRIVVTCESTSRKSNGIRFLPWKEFASLLWQGEFQD